MTRPVKTIKRERLLAVYTLLAIFAIAVAGPILDQIEPRQRLPFAPETLLVMRVVLGGCAVAILLLFYLRGDVNFTFLETFFRTAGLHLPSRPEPDEVLRLHREIAELRHTITAAVIDTSAPGISADAVLDALRSEFPRKVASELEEKFATAAVRSAYMQRVRSVIEGSVARLRDEIAVTNRRGNLNLVIGAVITMTGAAVLVYGVMESNEIMTTWPAIVAHYVPRVTTIIFIEVFGFFFLRLYRAGLAEGKYYQNELTNLTLYGVAIETAVQPDLNEAEKRVVADLLQVDRNTAKTVLAPLTSPTPTDVTAKVLEILKTATETISKGASGAK
jgi:hypothetical protein